ncbi:hypothetical protein BUALT_Bualt05G0116100 [Buddleja alternifolia]|uniref:Uncharacterized protein n=1 Tax=Buddleja alternifolia TaxID=168488 RepID=A0AAV6XRM8_9LAMI|nr:hypothetical protein BUALT_Bualt05G0116100 [Buddleja alternifolia]
MSKKEDFSAASLDKISELPQDSFQGTIDEFHSLLNNTLQGYHDRKLRINEFKLRFLELYDSESVSLLEKSILIAIHMGVKTFHLHTNIYHFSRAVFEAESFIELSLKGCRYLHTNIYHLPCAVFEAESFIQLSLMGCGLDHDKAIMFKHLKVLKLFDVYIAETTFQRIISSCPLIEDMELVECEGLRSINVNDLKNLHRFYFVYYDVRESWIEWGVTNLESITICSCTNWFQLHRLKEFPNLKYLSLTKVNLSGISLYHFMWYFPSLENLKFSNCYGFEEIDIMSDSIQYISLKGINKSIKARIDAPKILSFEFSGSIPPTLSFAKTYTMSKSDIRLDLDDASSLLWLKLSEMLTRLSYHDQKLRINAFELRFPELDYESVSLLEKWIPILIHMGIKELHLDIRRDTNGETKYWEPRIRMAKRFEGVSLNVFDDDLFEWRPLNETSLRKCALPDDGFDHEVRFQLKWKEAEP